MRLVAFRKHLFNSDSGKEFEVAKFAEAALPVVAAVAGVVIVAALLPEGAIVAIIEALTVSSSALAGFVGA